MKIALDCDGVLYHWDRTARYLLRRKFRNESREIPKVLEFPSNHWDAIEQAIPAPDWGWLWREGVVEGLFRYGHVVGGAIEGVTRLAELGEISIVTSRPSAAVGDTLAWLAFYLNRVPLAGIHILTEEQLKSTIRPHFNIYIDDGPHNITDVLANTDAWAGILFDRPWNKKYYSLSARFYRANDWDDVINTIKNL